MKFVRGCPPWRILSFAGAVALVLSGSTATAAVADETTPPPGDDGTIIFQAQDVSVEITAGIALAINQCIADASDGIIVEASNYCNQIASAGNLVETGSIVVSQSSDVSITVSGGTALAINECISDAADGIVETQQNACDQSATAQTLVIVESITIISSENITLSIDGGTASSVNSCIDLLENGTVEEQINACSQASAAFTVVEVGDILVEDSEKVKIKISGGKARAVVECVTSVVDGTADEQRNDCTYTVTEGSVVTVGTITILASEKVKIKITGGIPQSIRRCVEHGARGEAAEHPEDCSEARELRRKAKEKDPGSKKLLFDVQDGEPDQT